MSSDPTVLDLFGEQVRARPDAIAVEPAVGASGSSLTFQQLDRESDRLARALRSRGVGRESIVGVCSSRQPEMIVAIWGILKAGAAYLPLDLVWPQSRLEFMIGDANPACLINASSELPQIVADCPVVDIGDEAVDDASVNQIPAAIEPADLAYVIYTSGSTGNPKGVLLEHRGLAEMTRAHIAAFSVAPTSRVLQFASFSFDAAVSEVFMTLCAGATLCLADRSDLIPGRELIDLLVSRRISNVLLPPSALALLPEHPLPDLQTLVAGGERCHPELVRRWSRDRDFFNAYGPTEATVTATIQRCHPDDTSTPIGNAREFAAVYVLDEQRNPVPAGEQGELYLGGNGVARGYLNREDLTRQLFLADPFATNDRSAAEPRMYRTGDLVKAGADGALEFLGRVDNQVKLRGYRIELGEIETAIESHEHVRQAAAKLVQFADHDQRIVAWYHPDSDLTAESLRRWLSDQLPPQCIPATFVSVDSMPLTPGHKIDYHSLPDPASAPSVNNDAPAVELTDSQRTIRTVWSNLLGVPEDEFTIDDHFIELGGDSLLSVQIATRLESAGMSIRGQDILDHPTIRALDSLVSTRK